METSNSDSMRAITLTNFGGYEKIKIKDTPKPRAEENFVVIQIKACGMNFSDLYTRQGIYTFNGIKPPFVLGLEGAGIVTEIGPNVSNRQVGDRVLCWNFNYGMWAEYVSVHHQQCHPIPDNMTFMEANCIVSNYLTAYFVIKDFGNLHPNQSVLIQAAAGGVGWAATQIAKTIENVTIFGTASSSKHELIKENGVTHPIDYQNKDFVEEVLSISPQGVNVILDCLSGNDFIRAQKCLKQMGRIVHVGITSMISGEKRSLLKNLRVWWQTKSINLYNLIVNNYAVCGLSINTIFEKEPEVFQAALRDVLQLYAEGQIKPRIDSVWSFDEVVEATKCMVERKNVGKLILVPKKEDISDKVESFQN